ncbi:hypothetical protein G6011_08090 [Alternaria panax]|uniref:Uncharacterized protein n=1 Tax=Alternaria panax TaxID=48097 RepID=A0AAD4I8E3_9PLEO|nr:hypothetical protein G6011_08090 [Alternaria panax]
MGAEDNAPPTLQDIFQRYGDQRDLLMQSESRLKTERIKLKTMLLDFEFHPGLMTMRDRAAFLLLEVGKSCSSKRSMAYHDPDMVEQPELMRHPLRSGMQAWRDYFNICLARLEESSTAAPNNSEWAGKVGGHSYIFTRLKVDYVTKTAQGIDEWCTEWAMMREHIADEHNKYMSELSKYNALEARWKNTKAQLQFLTNKKYCEKA